MKHPAVHPAQPGQAPAGRHATGPLGRFHGLAHPSLWSAVLALVLYLPALGDGFVWDDHWLIEANPAIRGGGGMLRALVSDFWAPTGSASGYWRPLVVLSYGLDGAVSHWSAPWFHAVNLLAHAGTSAVVAALAAASGAGTLGSLAAGAWFAASPTHVESVAWIAGRTDVLCALFFLLAFALDRRGRGAGRPRPGAGTLALFGAALLSKETALVFLPLVALAEAGRAPGARRPRAMLRWLLPYAALAAIWLALHLLVTWHRPPPIELDPAHRSQARLAALTMFPRYLPLLLPWGAHTPAVVMTLPRAPGSPAVWSSALVHVGFAAIVAWLLKRGSRLGLPLALLWLALLPPAAAALTQGSVLFAERFLYLPSAGAACAAGVLLGTLARARRGAILAAGAALALAGGSAFETWRLLPHWKDDAALFEFMANSQPRNARAHTSWAVVLANQGRIDEAVAEIDAAGRLDPRLPEVYFARALVHYGLGHWPEAASSADTAIALDSLRLEPRVTRALARTRAGRTEQARGDLERLLAKLPGNPFVESAWGQNLLARGHTAEALPYLGRAAGFLSRDPDLLYGLGRAYASLDRLGEARAAFARAVAADSTLYDGWLNLAAACHLLGDAAGRERALARAATLPAAADGRAAGMRRRLLEPPAP